MYEFAAGLGMGFFAGIIFGFIFALLNLYPHSEK